MREGGRVVRDGGEEEDLTRVTQAQMPRGAHVRWPIWPFLAADFHSSNFLLPTSYFHLPTKYFLLPPSYCLLLTSSNCLLPSPASYSYTVVAIVHIKPLRMQRAMLCLRTP